MNLYINSRWVFTTLKRDISFGVYFKEEMGIVPLSMMEVIQPPTRVNCHMVPEDGLIHCSKIGTCKFLVLVVICY